MHPFQYSELAKGHRDDLLAEARHRRLLRRIRAQRHTQRDAA